MAGVNKAINWTVEARRAIRTAICWPFVDDGPIARREIEKFREERKTAWARVGGQTASEDEIRIALCEARYRDWQRSRFTVIQGGGAG